MLREIQYNIFQSQNKNVFLQYCGYYRIINAVKCKLHLRSSEAIGSKMQFNGWSWVKVYLIILSCLKQSGFTQVTNKCLYTDSQNKLFSETDIFAHLPLTVCWSCYSGYFCRLCVPSVFIWAPTQLSEDIVWGKCSQMTKNKHGQMLLEMWLFF